MIGLSADEFSERLSYDANGFGFVSAVREFALGGTQDGQRIGDLTFKGISCPLNKSPSEVGLRS
jgi:hypothetical protein